MTKKILIDGIPGSGKTTLLTCLHTSGYLIFEESIRKFFSEARLQGLKPFENLSFFLEKAIRQDLENLLAAQTHPLAFFDRGLPYYRFMQEDLKDIVVRLPEDYERIAQQNRYHQVFLFEPVWQFDMSVPRPNESATRIYTQEKRLEMHRHLKNTYQDFGYETTEVPIFSADKEANLRQRAGFITKQLVL
ncbi:MAG: ATP-binding protein [Verrucomicrobia bacterium]|nr:ATP-binding protein [Cytophagales bacterium]